MLLRALLLVIGALISVSGEPLSQLITDNLKMSADDIRACSKACAARLGVLCCDISDGIARSTTYERSLLGSNQWLVVAGAGKSDHSKRRETRLGEAVVWYASLRAVSKSAASSRPMPRERCAGTFCQEDAAFLIAEAAFAPFWSADQSDSVLLPDGHLSKLFNPAPGTP